jgi:hypothetical protein
MSSEKKRINEQCDIKVMSHYFCWGVGGGEKGREGGEGGGREGGGRVRERGRYGGRGEGGRALCMKHPPSMAEQRTQCANPFYQHVS